MDGGSSQIRTQYFGEELALAGCRSRVPLWQFYCDSDANLMVGGETSQVMSSDNTEVKFDSAVVIRLKRAFL